MILRRAKRAILLVFALNIEYPGAKTLDIRDPVSSKGESYRGWDCAITIPASLSGVMPSLVADSAQSSHQLSHLFAHGRQAVFHKRLNHRVGDAQGNAILGLRPKALRQYFFAVTLHFVPQLTEPACAATQCHQN